MSRVILNKVGTDIVDLSVTQTGDSETTVVLKDALLDEAKEYHFAVTELSIPLTNTSMFEWITDPTELFIIHRRNVSDNVEFNEASEYGETHADLDDFATQVLDDDVDFDGWGDQIWGDDDYYGDPTKTEAQHIAQIQLDLIAHLTVLPILTDPTDASYRIQPGRRFYDPLSFVKSLNEFANYFNTQVVEQGIRNIYHSGVHNYAANAIPDADQELLKFFLNCDGNLILKGNSLFWNNYMIKFSNTGAALLGINTTELTQKTLTFTGDVINATFVDNTDNDKLVVGANTVLLELTALQSIFQTSECRLKVSVDSHLPVQSNTEIREEVETVNREIAQSYFLNDLKVQAQWDQLGTFSAMSIKSNVYSGQYAFIHKNKKVSHWNRLLTAYNLQFFRFFIQIHYRVFSEELGTWGIQIERLDVPESEYWQMNVRFVSDE